MGDLTRNLSRHEFACKCGCGFNVADFELVTVLQDLVETVSEINGRQEIIRIHSGCRCPGHNKKVAGAHNSMHTKGIAADFSISNTDPREIAKLLNELYPNQYGIGLYNAWVHLDMRGQRARW